MWPIQLAFLLNLCRVFFCSLTLSNTTSFLTWSVQLISIPLQHQISKLSRYFWSNVRSIQVTATYTANYLFTVYVFIYYSTTHSATITNASNEVINEQWIARDVKGTCRSLTRGTSWCLPGQLNSVTRSEPGAMQYVNINHLSSLLNCRPSLGSFHTLIT
jgi:hypothetical protein